MTIVLFAGLGMWFYNPKNMKRTNLRELPTECVGSFCFIVKQKAGIKVLASQLFLGCLKDAVVEWGSTTLISSALQPYSTVGREVGRRNRIQRITDFCPTLLLFKEDNIRIWCNIEKLVVFKDQLDSVVFYRCKWCSFTLNLELV